MAAPVQAAGWLASRLIGLGVNRAVAMGAQTAAGYVGKGLTVAGNIAGAHWVATEAVPWLAKARDHVVLKASYLFKRDIPEVVGNKGKSGGWIVPFKMINIELNEPQYKYYTRGERGEGLTLEDSE